MRYQGCAALTEKHPEEARVLRNKLEIHYAPKHGSWLNMAEIEINMVVNHGLSKRIPTIEQMKKEVTAWNKARNVTVNKSIGGFQQIMSILNLNGFILANS